MPRDQALHILAAEFFREFSRTEYALKATGFNNGDGPAKANWSQFARSIEGLIAAPPTPELREAIAFLFQEPPKKQFIENDLIQWRVVPPNTGSRADDLFHYIRRVRNNLFHGGKFNGHWFAPERSERLIQAGLVVLRAAVEVEPNVSAAYHG